MLTVRLQTLKMSNGANPTSTTGTYQSAMNDIFEYRRRYIKYLRDSRTRDDPLGYVVSPDLTLQYNYVHQIADNISYGKFNDTCIKTGGLACTNVDLLTVPNPPVGNPVKSVPGLVATSSDNAFVNQLLGILESNNPVSEIDLASVIRKDFVLNINQIGQILRDQVDSFSSQLENRGKELATVSRELNECRAARAATQETVPKSDYLAAVNSLRVYKDLNTSLQAQLQQMSISSKDAMASIQRVTQVLGSGNSNYGALLEEMNKLIRTLITQRENVNRATETLAAPPGSDASINITAQTALINELQGRLADCLNRLSFSTNQTRNILAGSTVATAPPPVQTSAVLTPPITTTSSAIGVQSVPGELPDTSTFIEDMNLGQYDVEEVDTKTSLELQRLRNSLTERENSLAAREGEINAMKAEQLKATNVLTEMQQRYYGLMAQMQASTFESFTKSVIQPIVRFTEESAQPTLTVAKNFAGNQSYDGTGDDINKNACGQLFQILLRQNVVLELSLNVINVFRNIISKVNVDRVDDFATLKSSVASAISDISNTTLTGTAQFEILRSELENIRMWLMNVCKVTQNKESMLQETRLRLSERDAQVDSLTKEVDQALKQLTEILEVNVDLNTQLQLMRSTTDTTNTANNESRLAEAELTIDAQKRELANVKTTLDVQRKISNSQAQVIEKLKQQLRSRRVEGSNTATETGDRSYMSVPKEDGQGIIIFRQQPSQQ